MAKQKQQRQTGYLPQCMNLGAGRTVGQNISFIPYANEKAAQDHIAHHIATKGCTLAHRIATV